MIALLTKAAVSVLASSLAMLKIGPTDRCSNFRSGKSSSSPAFSDLASCRSSVAKSRASLGGLLACLAVLGLLSGPVMADQVDSNTDRPGGDLAKPVTLKPLQGSIAGSVETQCQALCAKNSACQAWTLVKAGFQAKDALCWLKSEIPEARSDPCCTSGIAERDSGSEFEEGVDRVGSDIDQSAGGDANACKTKCDRNGDCVAWTWVKPGVQGAEAQCYLKDDAPPPVEADCCTSGVKGPKLN